MATLTITADHDYKLDILSDITDIVFNTADFTTAIFAASQFDNVAISQTVHITGDANRNDIRVVMNSAGTFSAAGWTFSSWSLDDSLAVFGSSGADTIVGSSGANSIAGGFGADSLTGGPLNDQFEYGVPEELQAGETVDGGGGLDVVLVITGTYDFSVATLSNIEFLSHNFPFAATMILSGDQIGAGAITNVQGHASSTTDLIVLGSSVDLSAVSFSNWVDGVATITINGTAGVDSLTGSTQADVINGGKGNDSISGGAGNDLLIGGKGNDLLRGGIGDDIVRGGKGQDTLVGRASLDLAGSNVFDFNAKVETPRGSTHRDVILDFLDGQDIIDLKGIDAKQGVPGNQAFHFIGTLKFHHHRGELHYRLADNPGPDDDFTVVEGDTDGDGKPDFQIKLTDLHTLAAGDFVL
jgi:serralysin